MPQDGRGPMLDKVATTTTTCCIAKLFPQGQNMQVGSSTSNLQGGTSGAPFQMDISRSLTWLILQS
jgi:hypothetical protein